MRQVKRVKLQYLEMNITLLRQRLGRYHDCTSDCRYNHDGKHDVFGACSDSCSLATACPQVNARTVLHECSVELVAYVQGEFYTK